MLKYVLIMVFLSVGEFVGNSRQYIREVEVDYPFIIVKGDDMTLKLDERTVHPWAPGSCFQYIVSEGAVAYLNQIDSSIKLFDLKSGKTILTVPLSRRGPDTVGPEPVSFYWINRDSIFVFSNLNNGRLSLLNSEGEKLKSYELNSASDELAHTVELKQVSGGISYSKRMNALFLGLRVYSPQKMLKRAPYLKLDINSGKVDYFSEPQPYAESNLDKIPFDHKYTSTAVFYNDLSSELILDFPLSPNLWVKKKEEEWLTPSAQSVYYEKPQFLRSELTKYKNDRKKYMDEVRLMPRYVGLKYDPYRDVYYRIGRLPFNRELSKRRDLGEKLKIYQEFSIQVFDKDFKKIAENKFFDENLLFEQGLFVNEDGLWLLRPQGEDEDVMEFKLMKILKK